MKIKHTIGCMVFLLLFCIIPVQQGKAAEKTYLHEENFSMDYNLEGLFSSCETYIQVGDWVVKDAKLTLYYTTTNLVREEVSDFTVMLNQEPVYSQKMPLTAGETQEITIELPQRLLKKGLNSIGIEAYIRTNKEEPCKEDYSSASWMVIRKDSFTSISYEPKTICNDVADVYRQLTSIEALENNQSALFLPKDPTEEELSAGAYLLTGLSSNAAISYNKLEIVKGEEKDSLEGYSYGVMACEYNRVPSWLKELLSEEEKKAAETGGLISYLTPNDKTNLLLVTAEDTVTLQKASRLFGNTSNMEQSGKRFRKIEKDEDIDTLKKKGQESLLSETGSYVSGAFEQTASFNVTMAANRNIAADSEVKLQMRYAENLDFDRSLVTVYAGDVPIGSKKLEKSGANGDVLLVNIPSNLNISGDFTIRVVFNLEIKDLVCDVRRQEMPWAYVSPESTITLNTEEVSRLLFDYYPGPFVAEGRLQDVLLILPSKTSKEDLDAMSTILLTLGRYVTDNSGNIEVRKADNPGDFTGSNVISIGTFSENPIAREMNQNLYFTFAEDGSKILSNEKMKIGESYGETLGTAQLLYSPYGSDFHGLLLISGVTKEGMSQAANYLGNVEKLGQVFGDGFIADKESIHCYRFGEDNKRGITLQRGIAKRKSVILLLIMGGGVLLLLGISVLFIWDKHRKEG